MKRFKVPVTWEVYDTVEVEAETAEEAVKYVEDNLDYIPLGTEPEYVNGSYKTDVEDISLVEEC